jgi:hypothetical protein
VKSEVLDYYTKASISVAGFLGIRHEDSASAIVLQRNAISSWNSPKVTNFFEMTASSLAQMTNKMDLSNFPTPCQGSFAALQFCRA